MFTNSSSSPTSPVNSQYVAKLPAPPILHGRAIVELWCDRLQKYLLKKCLEWWVTSCVNIRTCVRVQSEWTLAQQQKFVQDVVADSVWCASKNRCLLFFSKVLHTGGGVMPINSPEKHHFYYIHSPDWHIAATVPFKTKTNSLFCAVRLKCATAVVNTTWCRQWSFTCSGEEEEEEQGEEVGLLSQFVPLPLLLFSLYLPSLNLFHFSLVFLTPSFPVFKPEELRQALMPTLEALYRQDPESLPFRQPVDPQLLGIPVRIRTSNKTNLVRDCTGCHFASTLLKT